MFGQTGEIHISIFQLGGSLETEVKDSGPLGDRRSLIQGSKMINYMRELHIQLESSFRRCFVHLAR